LFLGCVAFFAATNGLHYPLLLISRRDDILGMVIGAAQPSMMGAQMALHSIWCVLAPLHWAKRFLVGVTVLLVLCGTMAGGMAVNSVAGTDVVALATRLFWNDLLCLPLLLIAVQTPLWVMRIGFGWRVACRGEVPSTAFRPLRIGNLLIATAVVAAALAAARCSGWVSTPSGDVSIVGLVVAALIIVMVSAVIVLPAVLAALYARRLPMALGLAFAVDAAILVVCMAVVRVIRGAPLDTETFAVALLLAGGFFVSLTAPMLIARRQGYRLVRGRG